MSQLLLNMIISISHSRFGVICADLCDSAYSLDVHFIGERVNKCPIKLTLSMVA